MESLNVTVCHLLRRPFPTVTPPPRRTQTQPTPSCLDPLEFELRSRSQQAWHSHAVHGIGGTSKNSETLAWSLFLPIMVLAGPVAYVHHVIYLMPSVVVWLTWSIGGSRLFTACAIMSLCLVTSTDWPVMYQSLGAFGRSVGWNSLNLYGVLLLFLIGTWAAWTQISFCVGSNDGRQVTV